jgi:CheY-like chemotaxis protein
LWPCEYDKNQIGQVIDNIVINAQQAMPEGGTIEIEAANLQLAEKTHAMLPAGNYVRIGIKDHGIGMPHDILTKIFDPFFTTKARGHGLGLATCYSIIKRHDGCIEVESEPGKGSIFTMYLPASSGTAISDIAPAITIHHGSGSILVMDDEAVVRDTIGSLLKTMGYDVHCASNSKEAIEAFEKATREKNYFAAIILDLTIPGGPGGKETIREIRKVNKDIPAFVVSGYADDPVMANPSNYGFNGSICKPFMMADLASLLNRHMKKAG